MRPYVNVHSLEKNQTHAMCPGKGFMVVEEVRWETERFRGRDLEKSAPLIESQGSMILVLNH